MSMKIDIVKRTDVKPSERDEMYAVYSRYYVNVEHSRFEQDLNEKDWVILLRNPDSCIVGFSTQHIYKHSGLAGSAVIIYSGDTIVDRTYRANNGGLAGAFAHFLLRAIAEHPSMPVYWFLTSKGPRTYRCMPVFLKKFFPVFDQKTPENVKTLIDEVASKKFGADYSPETQVVSNNGKRDWLCTTEHDPLFMGRDDPHIRFFLEHNPGYTRGDELACIAAITEDNLNARAIRVIKNTEVQWRE